MIDAHRLLREHGLEGARSRAATKFDRGCIDAAARMLDQAGVREQPVFGGLAATCLPHRDPGDLQESTRMVGALRYTISTHRTRTGTPVGLPFGAKARLILLYLHDQAVHQQNATLAVNLTMHSWVRMMTQAVGGMTYRTIAEQAFRIACCRMSWTGDSLSGSGHRRPIVAALVKRRGDELAFIDIDDAVPHPDTFPDQIVLDRLFAAHVLAHPVAIHPAALRLISDNSWAIDVYVWLAHLLPGLTQDIRGTWDMLPSHFDLHYKNPRQMRASFLRALQMVLAIYPQAHVDVDQHGYRLWPSPAPL